MKAVFLFGLLVGLSAFAAEPAPQMVVGDKFVCLLSADAMGTENLVRCWDVDGREISTPRIQGVTRLTATERIACMQSPKQIYCWVPVLEHDREYDRSDASKMNRAFRNDLPADVFTAGGRDSGCTWSVAKGFACYISTELKDEEAKAGTRMKSAPENQPLSLSVTEDAVCDVSAKGEVHCFGRKSYDKNFLLELPVPAISQATEVAHTYHHACAIVADHLQCWGFWNKEKKDVTTPPMTAPLSLAINRDSAYVVDEGKVWQVKPDGTFEQEKNGPGELEHVGLVAASGKSHCAANDSELACEFDIDCGCGGSDRKPDPPIQFRISHEMRVAPAEIAAFDKLLTEMADNIYPEKKILVLSGTKIAKNLTARGRLFVYESLAPVVENADSDYVTKQVLPSYLRLQAHFAQRFKLFKPGDFEVSTENSNSALRLTQAAVASLGGVSPAWQDLTLKIGEALSTGEKSALHDVLVAIEMARSDLNVYQGQARTKGQAGLISGLAEYFRKVK